MKNNGYTKIYTKKDIQGIDRVVIGLKLWYNGKLIWYNRWGEKVC
jgi:hypothetical protein